MRTRIAERYPRKSDDARPCAPSAVAGIATSTDNDAIREISAEIVDLIRSGMMAPGQHLSEGDLARRFDLGRGLLRDALKQLSSEGIVTLTRYRGAFIAALDRKGVHDLLETLEPLCALAASRAAERCRAAEAAMRLTTITDTLRRQIGSGDRLGYLNSRHLFYRILVDLGGNAELGRIIPLQRVELFRAQFDSLYSRVQRRRHSAGYAKITRAVIDNDRRTAAREVHKHFTHARDIVDEMPDHVFAAGQAREE